MLQEMQIRNYSPRTVISYVHCIERMSAYFNSSPELLSVEQLKSYLHYCVTKRRESASTLNQIISAVRILYTDVLERQWEPLKLKRPRREKQLPVVFSTQEVSHLIGSVINLKHKMILAVAYSAGLRINEVRCLELTDVDRLRRYPNVVCVSTFGHLGQPEQVAKIIPYDDLIWLQPAKSCAPTCSFGRAYRARTVHFSPNCRILYGWPYRCPSLAKSVGSAVLNANRS